MNVRKFNRLYNSLPVRLAVILLFLSAGLPACAELLSATPMRLSSRIDDGERYMGIRLLGTMHLPSVKIDGIRLTGLSALAWDNDENLLYAVSDFGKVFHLRPEFQQGQLSDVKILAAYSLQDNKGQRLRPPWANAEGLALENGANGIKKDSRLLVAFEIRPRIRRYDATGRRLGSVKLPAVLRNRKHFRDPNQALEAITYHPDWGLLIAPEQPLQSAKQPAIYTLNNKSWSYTLAKAPNSSLVAMEALADGSLITLERAYTSPLRPLIISLRRVHLLESTAAALIQDVAILNSSGSWRLDNFEGLAHHQGRRFFMVSDDNRSTWQNTLLVYFEIL